MPDAHLRRGLDWWRAQAEARERRKRKRHLWPGILLLVLGLSSLACGASYYMAGDWTNLTLMLVYGSWIALQGIEFIKLSRRKSGALALRKHLVATFDEPRSPPPPGGA